MANGGEWAWGQLLGEALEAGTVIATGWRDFLDDAAGHFLEGTEGGGLGPGIVAADASDNSAIGLRQGDRLL
jgi:hypothetical protein